MRSSILGGARIPWAWHREYIARRRRVRKLEEVAATTYVEGPHLTNRASRRAAGDRGYGHGFGAAAIPKSRRTR